MVLVEVAVKGVEGSTNLVTATEAEAPASMVGASMVPVSVIGASMVGASMVPVSVIGASMVSTSSADASFMSTSMEGSRFSDPSPCSPSTSVGTVSTGNQIHG